MNDKLKYFLLKVQNQVNVRKNFLWQYLPLGKISLLGIDKIATKDKFIEILSSLLSLDSISAVHSTETIERISILTFANNAIKHTFKYLGTEVSFGNCIQWNEDIRNNYQWPKNSFYKYQLKCTPKGCDIKYPWELSRCHHLLWLGEAYIFTSDEKYAKEVVDELCDWIEMNPLMYTVNWTCSMDVAIRAVNWIYSLLFIKDSPYFTNEFAAKVYQSLYQHGFFIYNNLERTIPYSNNHYYSDIVGLLYLGRLFNDTRPGKKWFQYALRQYYQETLTQFLFSGINFEKSVSYHRLMSELAIYSYYMLTRVGINVPEIVRQRLIRMVQYVSLNAMPNGKAPLISDNDDGRLLPFVPRDFREHKYLVDNSSLENKIIVSGVSQLSYDFVCFESRLMQDSKIAILRRGHSYLFVTNADRWRYDKSNSKYIGTHIHNDLLSFVYAVGNTEILVDPGAYVYTSDIERHKEFRSTTKHNTIIVDAEEQHLRESSKAFMMKYNSTSSFLELKEEKDFDICTGEYTTIQGRLKHIRSFQLNTKTLIIKDRLEKTGKSHNATLFYHFAPGINPILRGSLISFNTNDDKFTLSVTTSSDLKIVIKNDTVSPSYGVLQESKTLEFEFEFDEIAEITTIITHN